MINWNEVYEIINGDESKKETIRAAMILLESERFSMFIEDEDKKRVNEVMNRYWNNDNVMNFVNPDILYN